jgi:hypothetical protein
MDRNTSKYAAQEETYIHTVTVKVTNKKPAAIELLTLRDMLPSAQDDRIKVVLKSPTELTDVKTTKSVKVKENVMMRWRRLEDGSSGEKLGWFEWLCSDINGNGTVEVQFTCEVTAPADQSVIDLSSNSISLYSQSGF